MKPHGSDMTLSGAAAVNASARAGPVSGLIRIARDRWSAARTRRNLRDLDRLDDRLLRDVGLRRDRFPGGTNRVARF